MQTELGKNDIPQTENGRKELFHQKCQIAKHKKRYFEARGTFNQSSDQKKHKLAC